MNVLIDTSVWIDHFKRGNPTLSQLIMADRALIHPMVLAEIACGTPPAQGSEHWQICLCCSFPIKRH